MEDKKTPSRPINADKPIFEETMQVSSASECTGMIPAMPPMDEDMDAYRQIYNIPLSSTSDAPEPDSDCGFTHGAPER